MSKYIDINRSKNRVLRTLLISGLCGFLVACDSGEERNTTSTDKTYDILIDGGLVYDGSGASPRALDVAIKGDRIVALGQFAPENAKEVINAEGMAVAPGFINMLSWGADALIHDGRGLSDVTQGVTLEVFGEGWSMGPLTEPMKNIVKARQTNLKYDIEWNTLGEFLTYLENRGVSPNIASYVGAATVRVMHLGPTSRAPNENELAAMQQTVAEAMEEGAMGLGAALIYPPGSFATDEELTALAAVAGRYGGSYQAHMRSEGDRLEESVDGMIRIAEQANMGVEIYHLKAAGKANWPKMDRVIAKINEARARGTDIRANMYTYTAGSTGLSASMPPWLQEGGVEAWMRRLQDPSLRARIIEEINSPGKNWENIFMASGGADNVILVGFKSPALQYLTGKTLAEAAELRGQTPAEAIIDLIVEDGSRVEAVYFMMSEENLKKQMQEDWVSFQSDAPTMAPEGAFLDQSVHPRAYGTFARLLGKYVRNESVMPLEEAIRRLTSLPAENLKIKDRGLLQTGFLADVVVFDPNRIEDNATFIKPHQLSSGMQHVFVNGEAVIRNGQHTGATPGRFVKGPGYKGQN
ncbi:N-acyl-D-amino-acid deacylase family protein [Kordiimonas sp.]|uniref:N-acyl-D-amino-acid deacylase family protein n=1 Tax=Kordiimonas sp. TaxID=1970157 RepID=UPI003A8F740E